MSIYRKFSILHPVYAIDGYIDQRQMQGNTTTKILLLDRNVFQYLLKAAKIGSFDGEYRKALTALIVYASFYDYYICPYDAIKEQAYTKNDNVSGNKELDLFNYLFDSVGFDTILKSYCDEGVCFPAKSFGDASEEQNLDFLNDNADFLFLYATILHFAYVLHSEQDKEKQFKKFFKWYFEKALISGYALTYAICYFTKEGIDAPHRIYNKDIEKIIDGCKNQALDLCYLQEIDPRRYEQYKYTFFIVTNDRLMATIFKNYHRANNESIKTGYNKDESMKNLMLSLCDDLPVEKKERYISFLEQCYQNHNLLCVNSVNALDISKQLAEQEEKQLRDYLLKSR